MGDAKARRFLGNHDHKQVNSMWEYWKEICQILTNESSNPYVARQTMEVWIRLVQFLTLLRKQKKMVTYGDNFKVAIISLIQEIKKHGERKISRIIW